MTHEDVLARTVQADAVIIVAVLGRAKSDFNFLGQARANEAVARDVELERCRLRGQDMDALFLVAFVDHAYLKIAGWC